MRSQKMNSSNPKTIKFLISISILITTSLPVLAEERCTLISSKATTFYFGIETPLPDVNHPVTIDFFHTDIEVAFTQTGWDISVASDQPNSPLEESSIAPEDALLYGNINARIMLPSIPSGFEFVGAKAGQTLWVLPQTGGSGVLPLGIAAEQADVSRLCLWNPDDHRGARDGDKWFEVKLVAVRGPADANFSIWQADGINPPVVFVSTYGGGITDDDVFYISAGSHTHINWGFTKPGLYEVDFRISTVYKCDNILTADIAPIGNEFYKGNCFVDFNDFALLASHWLQTGCGVKPNPCEETDLDGLGDGKVGFSDLAILAAQWLRCGYPGCEH